MTGKCNRQIILVISALMAISSLPFPPPSHALTRSKHDEAVPVQDPLNHDFEFEVVTLRPHKPGSAFMNRLLTPDGYRASMSIGEMIMLAYNPQPGGYRAWSHIQGAPAWIHDIYDIKARVAPEDMAVWQAAQRNDQVFNDLGPLRSALRIVLRERCNLIVRTTRVSIPYLDIVVGKHGAKLKSHDDVAIKPLDGNLIAFGAGFFIQTSSERRFFNVSMQDLASLLTLLSQDAPVQDNTGLTGRYDFSLPWYDYAAYSDTDLGNPLNRMPIGSLGLALRAGKGPALDLVIQRIDKPDEN